MGFPMSHQVLFIAVVMGAALLVRSESNHGFSVLGQKVFKCPAEASRAVLINSLENEKKASKLEYSCACEGSYTPSGLNFIIELRTRSDQR